MRLTQKPVFRAEDFPGIKDSPRLFGALNPLITNLNQIFDNNIDYSTNIRSVTKYFDQIGITLPVSFLWPYDGYTPASLEIIKSKVNGSAACMKAAWDFNTSTNTVTISAVYILGASTNTAISTSGRYEFTVRVSI